MTTRLCRILLAMVMTVSAWAQPKPDTVILPVELPGYYDPLDSEALAKILNLKLQSLAPEAGLQLSRGADLTAFGYRAGNEQPPTLEVADKICRAYGAGYVCWVSIRFQPDFKPETKAVAVAGAARFWAYSGADRKVIFDQPLSLVRVGEVKNANDEVEAGKVARELAAGCIGDLAYQILGVARQRNARPPTGVSTWSPQTQDATQSSGYKDMVRTTKDYQRAVRDQNFIDMNSAEASMRRSWVTLNQKERDAIGRDYPDLKEVMTRAPAYDYGGYSWPGYYRAPIFIY